MSKDRALYNTIVIVLSLIISFVLITTLDFQDKMRTDSQIKDPIVVETFETCVEAGGQVRNSAPPRCVYNNTNYFPKASVTGVSGTGPAE